MRILLLALCIIQSGCVTFSLSYTDPKNGATVAITGTLPPLRGFQK